MASSAWRWDESPQEAEDPTIGRSAASLTRVPIRTGERPCNRRKAGDLTFDPTSVHSDSAPDLFAKPQRAGDDGAAGVVERTSPAGTHADSAPGQPHGSANGSVIDPYNEDAGSLLGSGGRAALTRAKPATRRRSPLFEPDGLNGADRGDKSASSNRQPEARSAVIDLNAAPATNGSETKPGWRSAFSRWRKRVALSAAAPANGFGRTPVDEAAPPARLRPG